MSDRAKLAELIKTAKEAMRGKEFTCDLEREFYTAEYLIANGVTVRQRQKPIAEGMNPLEKCEQCPNFIFEDVQAYIQMLVAQNAELVRKNYKLQSSMGQVAKELKDNGFQTLEELLQAYNQVKMERDAAVEDIRRGSRCAACKQFFHNGGRCSGGSYCVPMKFEWRGLPEPPKEA